MYMPCGETGPYEPSIDPCNDCPDLTNYYTKTETDDYFYNKTEIDSKFGLLGRIIEDTGRDVAVPDRTDTQIRSIELDPGVWDVIGFVEYGVGGSGKPFSLRLEWSEQGVSKTMCVSGGFYFSENGACVTNTIRLEESTTCVLVTYHNDNTTHTALAKSFLKAVSVGA